MIRKALFLLAAILIVACGVLSTSAAKGPHRLGGGLDASLNEAGIPVDDAGNSAIFFAQPVTNPLTGQVVAGCNPAGFYGDFNSCVLTTTFVCGEHKMPSSAQLTPAQCTALFNLLKAGAQAQLADAGSEASFQ
jgi:hypothetical protein